MKKITLLLVSSLASLVTAAQSTSPAQFPKLAGNTLQTTYMANMVSQPVRPMDQINLSGSPYLNEAFKVGFVRIRNGFVKMMCYFVSISFKKHLSLSKGN